MYDYSIHFYSKARVTLKFIRLLENFCEDGVRVNAFIDYFFKAHKRFLFSLTFGYVRVYNNFINRSHRRTYFYFKKIKNKKKRHFYNLIVTFCKEKFFVNLIDRVKVNYLFLSTGFFIKYFDKKKLYKKSKIIRTLLIRYLRKIFLLIKIPRTFTETPDSGLADS